MTRTERRQKEKKERKGANCRGQGTRENLGGGEKGRGGTRTIIRWGKSSKLNFKGQSLDIIQADVRGMEKHHPIMDKRGGLGGRTYRQSALSIARISAFAG